MISKIISNVSSLLFPSYCYLCKEEGEFLCERCLSLLDTPVDTPHPYIHSLYSFKKPPVKKIVHAIKYFHRKDLITPIAKKIAEQLRQEGTHVPSDAVLIPIPMPRMRKYLRGHNHTEALAEALASLTNLPVRKNILLRLGSRKRQVLAKTRGERLKNQHGAFTVTTSIKNLNIILVDDVTTTGATLSEARNLLLRHGAKNVLAVTIAH